MGLRSLKGLFFLAIILFSSLLVTLVIYSHGGKSESISIKQKVTWSSAVKGLWGGNNEKTHYVDSDDEEDFEVDNNVHVKQAVLNQQADLTQKLRLESLAQGCRGYRKSMSELSPRQVSNMLKHIVVNEQYKFLYCFIPKVACSNWKRTIMALENRVDNPNSVKRVIHRNFTFLSDLPQDQVLYRLKNYFKFMFVRPPLERLVSAYRNKFAQKLLPSFHKSFGRRIVRRYRQNATKAMQGNDVTFTEFVHFIIDSKTEEMNEHWMPYIDLCQPCTLTYNFIGTLKTLDDDVNQVLQKVGAPVGLFPEKQSYYIPTNDDMIKKYLQQLPEDMKRKLLKKYKTDFSLFQHAPFQ